MKTLLKIFLLALLTISIYANADAQKPVTWQKVLDYTDVCSLNKTIQTSDRGYISTGDNRINNFPRLSLTKFNEYGDTLWNRYFNSQSNFGTIGYWIDETFDRGFIISGISLIGALLIKIDSLGNYLWYNTFGGEWARAHCVRQLQDKGFIILTSTYSYGPTLDILVTKTDSLGKSIWNRRFGGDNYAEYGVEIRPVYNNGYIIAGTVRPGHENLYLLRISNNGDSLWSRTYTEYLSSEGYSVDNTDDGGFLIGGICDSLDNNNKKSYILKTDSLGIIQWSKSYTTNFNEWCFCARNAGNSKYVMCGMSDSLEISFERAFIRLLDITGNVLREKFYRGGDGEIQNSFYSVENTTDKGFILSGFTEVGSGKGFVVKTDSLLNVIPVGIFSNEEIANSFELYQNYPNPFNSQTIIKYYLHKPGIIEFNLFDITGRVIISEINKFEVPGEKKYLLNSKLFNLSSGVYFYKIIYNKNHSQTKKLIVLK